MWAAEVATPVSRPPDLAALPQAEARRNRVSSAASPQPADRERTAAVFTWVRIWSSPRIWDSSPQATAIRWRAHASPRRVTKAWAKGS